MQTMRRWSSTRAAASGLALLAVLVTVVIEILTGPDVLLIGNVTTDVIVATGEKVPGGAVSYAANVISAFGRHACVVHAAATDANTTSLAGHAEVHIPASATLTFQHSYTWWGNHRKLAVSAAPNVTIGPEHVPQRCWSAPLVILAPLMTDDLDAGALTEAATRHSSGLRSRLQAFLTGHNGGKQVAILAQGLQRELSSSGQVQYLRAPSPGLVSAVGPHVSVFFSDVEVEVWEPGKMEEIAAQSRRMVVTKGENGALEIGNDPDIPPEKIPTVKVETVDTNGAGDTFATSYMLSEVFGAPAGLQGMSPGGVASWVAADACSLPQSCKPGCVGQKLAAMARGAVGETWGWGDAVLAHAEGMTSAAWQWLFVSPQAEGPTLPGGNVLAAGEAGKCNH